jgi:hypothetical protein
VIERTANFVALQGIQMEIIIKAKHHKHKGRFGFLEFDHPLNSFYKYMCKLIREKKYTPKPQKRKLLPGEHTVPERPEAHESNDEDSDSDGGDYIHPLLMAATKPKLSSTTPVPTPIPVPVPSSKVRIWHTKPLNVNYILVQSIFRTLWKSVFRVTRETRVRKAIKVS